MATRQGTELPSSFGVVDLFAGPGGLGEGFTSVFHQGRSPFRIGVSVEKEAYAHRTLRLRAFLREYRQQHGHLPVEYLDFHAGDTAEPDWKALDEAAWSVACAEAQCLELGAASVAAEIDAAISDIQRRFDDTIVIGGPPCQAYSLVGRARARGKLGYVPEKDSRHFLFREYIRVLDRLRPAAFVMENVTGMLSSSVQSRRVFEMIMEDLSSLGAHEGAKYELYALDIEDGAVELRAPDDPKDFIVCAEDFGVPQRRHRVIIIGLRSDISSRAAAASVGLSDCERRTVEETIGDLPQLRSGLSRGGDSAEQWEAVVIAAANRLQSLHRKGKASGMAGVFRDTARRIEELPIPPRRCDALPDEYGGSNDPLKSWLENEELRGLAHHDTRTHMASDLERYLFTAVHGHVIGVSPKATNFPPELCPAHKNWHTGDFADRFRVQLANEPSTTVTSHISKDGHYFIHPDPAQCRSLTVREAARLQTFPDDYLFLGSRTEQYIQVGNAVPPYLARQIAHLLARILDSDSVPEPNAHEGRRAETAAA